MKKIDLINAEIAKAQAYLDGKDFEKAENFIKRVISTYSTEIDHMTTGFSDYKFFGLPLFNKTDENIRQDLELLISKLKNHIAI